MAVNLVLHALPKAFDLGEETLGRWRVVFIELIFKRTQELALLLIEVYRGFDRCVNVEIAERFGAQDGHAFAAHAELATRLCSGGDSYLGAATGNGRHFDRAAKSRCCKRNWNLTVEIGAIALKNVMRPDGEEDIEITLRSAAQTGLTFACQTNAGAFFDAFGNVYIERTVLFDPA